MSDLRPIFILSLPRSGSTLLQRLLAGHGQIRTQSEPAILLPMLYGLREGGVASEYGHRYYHRALSDFIATLPNGRETYLASVREYALSLYREAGGAGGRYFLDKTPRYSLVASELMETFPDARFVFLWRNPLAVMASIIETWGQGRWLSWVHKIDLYQGFEGLWRAFDESDASLALRYEDLVRDPRGEVARVLGTLDLDWDDGITEGLAQRALHGSMGDRRGSSSPAVVADGLDRWTRTLRNPLRKAWARRYLRWIGEDRLRTMGYDLDRLLDDVGRVPGSLRHLGGDVVRSAYGEVNSTLQLSLIWRSWRQASAPADLIRYD